MIDLGGLTTVLERVNVPIAYVAGNGLVGWANEAFRRTYGDLDGRPFVGIAAPDTRSAAAPRFEVALAGRRLVEFDVDTLTADGSRLRAAVSAVPVDGGEGGAGAVVFATPTGEAARPRTLRAASAPLSPRQLEVLRLLSEGASTCQIATALDLKRETVRNYVRQILQALRAHSRLEAVVKARQAGIVGD
jgi:DNA-binding CsgD family transcriptional regulator